ncbi:MAG: ABC transporter substrate-binding protein [Actinobacteria bacterium]|nr:MAG: ABC transporter substrate-binding protein [Actinomycetota bacterium]
MRIRSRHFAFALTIVLAASLLLAVGCKPSAGGSGGTTPTETKTPIKIGVVVSLTGPYATLGEPEKATLEMEAKRINDAGGVNGHPIELVFEDDGTDEAKATAAAAKLIQQDKVAALIGATGTGQTMAMRGDVDKGGIPQVSMAGGTAITANFDKLVFATPWSNKIVIPYELKYMQKKGIKKIGLISDSGGFGKDGAAVVKAEASKYGITITSEQTFNAKDPDMSVQLGAIKDSGAEAILLVNAGGDAATVAKNRESLKITLPMYGTHGNARVEFIQGAGTAAEGFTFAAGKVLVPETYGVDTEGYTVATDFIERFTAATGKAPSTFAGHAYDALYIVVDAMKALPEGFTSAQLRDQIEKTAGFVGIGGTFNFTATDHNGLTEGDLVMYTIENGAWKVVE